MRRLKTKSNPGIGKHFLFFGAFRSKILAARAERAHPGSFILRRGNRWYVLKQKTKRNPRRKTTYRRKNHINPARGTLIYGRVLKIFAQKTSGPFKGQRFVHTFKAGAIMTGMPDGSIRISHP